MNGMYLIIHIVALKLTKNDWKNISYETFADSLEKAIFWHSIPTTTT